MVAVATEPGAGSRPWSATLARRSAATTTSRSRDPPRVRRRRRAPPTGRWRPWRPPGDRFCVAVQWHPETAADVGPARRPGEAAAAYRPERPDKTDAVSVAPTELGPRRARRAVDRRDDRAAARRRGRRSSPRWSPPRAAEHDHDAAVLHVHGFADYFFQTEYAEWWLERGYDFYALDLRKYGRSLRPHQTPNYVTDLQRVLRRDRPGVDPDRRARRPRPRRRLRPLDRRADVRRSGPTSGSPSSSPAWCSTRPGSTCTAAPGCALAGTAGAQPGRAAPADARDPARGHRLLRAQPAPRPRGRVGLRPHLEAGRVVPGPLGWLRADPPRATPQLHRGLSSRCPVLVLSSGAHRAPGEMGDDVHGNDVVLDVPADPAVGHRRSAATSPTSPSTGARHDVVLSRPEPRARSTTSSSAGARRTSTAPPA